MFTADPGSQQDLNQACSLSLYLFRPQYPPKYGTSCTLDSAGDTGAQSMCIEWTVLHKQYSSDRQFIKYLCW